MIDDQDRCEWMNVSSHIGSPGQSQTKGRKMVVVVVVVVFAAVVVVDVYAKNTVL